MGIISSIGGRFESSTTNTTVEGGHPRLPWKTIHTVISPDDPVTPNPIFISAHFKLGLQIVWLPIEKKPVK